MVTRFIRQRFANVAGASFSPHITRITIREWVVMTAAALLILFATHLLSGCGTDIAPTLAPLPHTGCIENISTNCFIGK